MGRQNFMGTRWESHEMGTPRGVFLLCGLVEFYIRLPHRRLTEPAGNLMQCGPRVLIGAYPPYIEPTYRAKKKHKKMPFRGFEC